MLKTAKKKLSTNDELTNKTEKPDLPTDVTLDYADIEDDNENDGVNLNFCHVDEVNLDLIVKEFGIHEKKVLCYWIFEQQNERYPYYFKSNFSNFYCFVA
jgi:hypothetical protein